MTPTETAKVITMIRAFAPQQRLADDPAVLVTVWHAVIGDLPYDAVERAVVAHYRVAADPWIQPGQIRRRVAADAGLLAPTEQEAWMLAQQWVRRAVRLDALPSAVGLACQAVADVLRSDAPDGVRHAAYRDAYRATSARHDERTLEATADRWPAIAPAARGRLAYKKEVLGEGLLRAPSH